MAVSSGTDRGSAAGDHMTASASGRLVQRRAALHVAGNRRRGGAAERPHVRGRLPRGAFGQCAGEAGHLGAGNAVADDVAQRLVVGRVPQRGALQARAGAARAGRAVTPRALRFEETFARRDVGGRRRPQRRNRARRLREAYSEQNDDHAADYKV